MLYLTYLNELFETMIVKYFVSFHLIFPSSIKILIMLNGRQNSLYHVHIYAHRLACTCLHTRTHTFRLCEQWSTCQVSGLQQNCCQHFCLAEVLFYSSKILSANNVQSSSNLIKRVHSE